MTESTHGQLLKLVEAGIGFIWRRSVLDRHDHPAAPITGRASETSFVVPTSISSLLPTDSLGAETGASR